MTKNQRQALAYVFQSAGGFLPYDQKSASTRNAVNALANRCLVEHDEPNGLFRITSKGREEYRALTGRST